MGPYCEHNNYWRFVNSTFTVADVVFILSRFYAINVFLIFLLQRFFTSMVRTGYWIIILDVGLTQLVACREVTRTV